MIRIGIALGIVSASFLSGAASGAWSVYHYYRVDRLEERVARQKAQLDRRAAELASFKKQLGMNDQLDNDNSSAEQLNTEIENALSKLTSKASPRRVCVSAERMRLMGSFK